MADDGSPQRTTDFRTAVEDVKALATVFVMEAESVLGRRTARVLGVLILFVVVVGTLLAVLDWYIAPSGAEQKQALVVTLAQILGGTALLSGVYFTWRTLQVNREGQITERFTRAIEQLGATHDDNSKNLELRLGGIYALERIARESEKDHWSIMEVLTAYVRQHAPLLPKEGQEGAEHAALEKKSEENSRGESEPAESPVPAADIQAIMTVIGRRTRFPGHGEPERPALRLDLHETNLSGADLRGANLRGANLRGANLRSAKLNRANLRLADLEGADLTRASLRGAKLNRANLRSVVLSEAEFWIADLSGAILLNANLSGAKLEEADFSKAYGLTQAQLEKTTGDELTQLPPNLEVPAHWDVWIIIDEQAEGD